MVMGDLCYGPASICNEKSTDITGSWNHKTQEKDTVTGRRGGGRRHDDTYVIHTWVFLQIGDQPNHPLTIILRNKLNKPTIFCYPHGLRNHHSHTIPEVFPSVGNDD